MLAFLIFTIAEILIVFTAVLMMVAYYAWNAPDAGTIYEHRSTVHAWEEARAAECTENMYVVACRSAP